MDDQQGAPPSSGVEHPVLVLCRRLGARLDELGDPGLWSVPDTAVSELVRATETQLRRLAAWQAKAVAEAQRRDLAKTVAATGPVPWVAGTLTCRRSRARDLCRTAAALDRGVQATVDAFGAGRIDADQAQVIATAVHGLPDQVGDQTRRQAESYLLEQARTHSADILAGLAGHLLEVVAPQIAEQRLAERLARDDAADLNRRNRLCAMANRHGRISLAGELDVESWALVSSALEPFAKPTSTLGPDQTTQPDTRTAARRAADALVELCRRQLVAHDAPTSHGFPAHVAVTIDADTLRAGLGAGLLDTGDPISAADIRRLACDATIIPVLLDTHGVPLDVGRTIRVFTKELRRAVEVRDIGCAFPGCTRPADWTNVHHIVHWVDGGPTTLDNGVLLCGTHHRTIHRGDWHVQLGTHRKPEFLPPPWIDPNRTPLRNTAHLRL